jgi:hypothetical protein
MRPALVAAAILLLSAAPVLSGPEETALLASYAGGWIGSGKVTGIEDGAVDCTMTLTANRSGKVNYSGRCDFGSGTAGFTGTMHYNDAARRFEANTSAQGVSGGAVGKRQGGGIVFSMSGLESSYGTVSSTLSLSGGKIGMKFELLDKDGKKTASSITFNRS